LRHVKLSLMAGLVVESIFFALDFSAKGELTGQHDWLEISQLPGAEMALRIFFSRNFATRRMHRSSEYPSAS